MLSMGSSMQAGLRSATTTFNPVDAPTTFAAASQDISYAAEGYFDAKGSLLVGGAEDNPGDEGAKVAKDLSEMPWFGHQTPKNSATRFEFTPVEDFPSKTQAYKVEIEVKLAALSAEPGTSSSNEPNVRLSGVGFRTKNQFTTKGLDVREMP